MLVLGGWLTSLVKRGTDLMRFGPVRAILPGRTNIISKCLSFVVELGGG